MQERLRAVTLLEQQATQRGLGQSKLGERHGLDGHGAFCAAPSPARGHPRPFPLEKGSIGTLAQFGTATPDTVQFALRTFQVAFGSGVVQSISSFFAGGAQFAPWSAVRRSVFFVRIQRQVGHRFFVIPSQAERYPARATRMVANNDFKLPNRKTAKTD